MLPVPHAAAAGFLKLGVPPTAPFRVAAVGPAVPDTLHPEAIPRTPQPYVAPTWVPSRQPALAPSLADDAPEKWAPVQLLATLDRVSTRPDQSADSSDEQQLMSAPAATVLEGVEKVPATPTTPEQLSPASVRPEPSAAPPPIEAMSPVVTVRQSASDVNEQSADTPA